MTKGNWIALGGLIALCTGIGIALLVCRKKAAIYEGFEGIFRASELKNRTIDTSK